jgi:hypothetical protein
MQVGFDLKYLPFASEYKQFCKPCYKFFAERSEA